MSDLAQKKCVPCEGIGKALTAAQAQEHVRNVPGWNVSADAKSISRSYVLSNFVEAVDLINKIKDVAEQENHHPDLHLTGYKNLQVVLSTHALKGISENDFILAAKINRLKG